MNKKTDAYEAPQILWKFVLAEEGFALSNEFSLDEVDEKNGEW